MDLAPYFTDYVRQILEASEEIGPERLYTNGLRVYTTLDLDQQSIADDEMKRALEKSNAIGRAYAKAEGKTGVDIGLFDVFNKLSMILPVGQPDIKKLDDRGRLRKILEEEGYLDALQMLTFSVPARNESGAFEELRKETVSFLTNLEVQGAFVTIEPRTGYITTMIGGSEFSPRNQFNRALQARRQPGSAFKVFVYGAAYEDRAIGTMSTLSDSPFYAIDRGGGLWAPANYDEGFRGLVPATTAMALSLNTCSVQVFYKVGPKPIINFAQRLMKITSENRFTQDPSLALGTSEITPMELATAMAILGNDGRDVIPFPIRYIVDSGGNAIYNQESLIRKTLALKSRQNRIQVIDPSLVYLIRKTMRAVADRGTATHGLRSPDLGNFQGDMACKTGTTSSWSDAWIAGFNPDYATVVWFGFDKSSITLGPGQAGGSIAAPVLGSYLRRYYRGLDIPYPSFGSSLTAPPPGVIPTSCNGEGLKEVRRGGVLKSVPLETICASEEHRIYDQRELLMKELGITNEDLGVKKNELKFKKGD
jgi:penicillin-binding protein 1A